MALSLIHIYCSLEDKAKLLDLLLDVVPDPIPVTVRTPNIFAKWAGIEESELGEYVLEPNSKASRVGLYNDCLLYTSRCV